MKLLVLVLMMHSITCIAQTPSGTRAPEDLKGLKFERQTDTENLNAMCGLMRTRSMEVTEVCRPDEAAGRGLTQSECSAVARVATEQCDVYARSMQSQPLTLAQCFKAGDRMRKCTTAISLGCEYSKPLALKMESVEGMKDVDLMAAAIRSECPRPDPKAMATKAANGTLRVQAISSR
jgi:hypothetical protein